MVPVDKRYVKRFLDIPIYLATEASMVRTALAVIERITTQSFTQLAIADALDMSCAARGDACIRY